MTFDQDPVEPTGDAGESSDPAARARMAQVEEIDMRVGSLVDEIVDDERLTRWIAARRADRIDQLSQLVLQRYRLLRPKDGDRWDQATRAKRDTAMEISCALKISEKAAGIMIDQALTLVHDLPATHAALANGDISYQNAQTITHEVWFLPDSIRPEFEEAVVPEAMTKTPPRFRERIKKIRERLHPVPLEERHQHALKERSVILDIAPDGMATLTYTDGADKVVPIYNRIDKTARLLQGPKENRTLPQLRADALADLGLNGKPSDDYDKGVKPTVLIAVPVLTAMGTGAEPGMMQGYGPIDPETARRLAATAPSFQRILTDPDTGAVLSLGRKTYRVPADLRRWLQLRDGTCRGPGCATIAERCDVDHTVDWQYGGETDAENLAHLCQSHHNFKQFTEWTYRHLADGRLEWTSPSGRSYITEPNSFIEPTPFTWPDEPSGAEGPEQQGPTPEAPRGGVRPDGPSADEPSADGPNGTAEPTTPQRPTEFGTPDESNSFCDPPSDATIDPPTVPPEADHPPSPPNTG
ncbi:HNH endonuclease signature motif containing protein [Glaciihabitans sp. dw_435]|uniref:HNH endonuclease n=1 Tax=Glaciihabitans sp. dw_435 TaxID=2720081 RepID=UPI001BD66D5D|nr:HNH endonuclease signature motif containing protein [Glaciihabitans sp. dw_435]